MLRRILRLFWEAAWHHKKLTVAIIGIAPLTFLFHQFLPPLIIAHILNRLVSGDYTSNEFLSSFGPILLLYAAVFLLGNVVLWRLLNWLMMKLEVKVTRYLMQRIFDHLLRLDMTFHDNHYGGALVSQATSFVGAYSRLADTTVLTVGGLVMAFLFTTIILLPQVPLFVAVLYGLTAIYVGIALRFSRRVHRINIAHSQAQSRQTAYLADNITNILTIKSFATEQYETGQFERITHQTAQAGNRLLGATIRRNSYFSLVGAAFSISAVTVAVVSVMFFRADIGTVFLMLTLGLNIVQKLWDFSTQALRDYNRALADAHDMANILAQSPAMTDAPATTPTPLGHGAVRFQDVNFGHDSTNDQLFAQFNLTIQPGQKVGLIGVSGAGKTTLVKLLLRFVEPTAGRIFIDSHDITRLRQDDLHRAIAYVPQEPLLFHRSIGENIQYGRPNASLAEVRAAAHRAHAMEFIEQLPQGFETLVGERGVKLSGGQRQRVALARAILKDAPILVLDEATSALDSVSEQAVQAALKELMEGRTTIAIAHRLSTIQHMDRIIVLDGGKIVEDGPHKTLLKQNGIYAKLWQHQSGGFLSS